MRRLARRLFTLCSPAWVVMVLLSPFFAAFIALVVVLVMGALTGFGSARWGGFRESGFYYVMDGKPPVPTAVPAAYWWASYALETTVTYGLLVTMVEVVVFAVVMGVGTELAHLNQAARRRARTCVACGCDLRASPGRCPECGASAQGA